jgi:hypothetical protein
MRVLLLQEAVGSLRKSYPSMQKLRLFKKNTIFSSRVRLLCVFVMSEDNGLLTGKLTN